MNARKRKRHLYRFNGGEVRRRCLAAQWRRYPADQPHDDMLDYISYWTTGATVSIYEGLPPARPEDPPTGKLLLTIGLA